MLYLAWQRTRRMGVRVTDLISLRAASRYLGWRVGAALFTFGLEEFTLRLLWSGAPAAATASTRSRA